ncbi:MAG: hypothetical protein ACOY3K_08465 [Candidatus Omnitrophota bacterium]
MSLEEIWEKALRNTEVVRFRINPLLTSETTNLPYVFLAESSVNQGDTVIRQGEILVEKPSLILPQHLPQFQGFEFEKELGLSADFLNTFFLVRGVRFPSFWYNHTTVSLDLVEGALAETVRHQEERLRMKEDVSTGLVVGPEDCWQFSVIIMICYQVLRQADGDIKKLLEDYRRGKK